MIVSSEQMRTIEKNSGEPTEKLMLKAGTAVAKAIQKKCKNNTNVLIVAGNGNNGGDGFVVCQKLKNVKTKVFLIDGKPKTPEAKAAFSKVPASKIIEKEDFDKALEKADIIVDAIYGFGFHGKVKNTIRKYFKKINSSNAKVFSIDINSGCESDTGFMDNDAIVSDITFALDCLKPFHLLAEKEQIAKKIVLLDLKLPHPNETTYPTMNEQLFFKAMPKKDVNAYKTSFGKILLIGGSNGLAGSISLNILGAKTVGASYIQVALPQDIYPIVASQHITPVMFPLNDQPNLNELNHTIEDSVAIGIGSGLNNYGAKEACLDAVLQYSSSPVVLDAEAIRLMQHNTFKFKFVHCPIIMTPHIGEFASLMDMDIEDVKKRRIEYAQQYAKEHNITLVLKGPNTIVVDKKGNTYINQTGNAALAQAGSGDILTGMITAMCSFIKDPYLATCMAVWLHGYIADIGLEQYATPTFALESFPTIMNALYKKHQF